MTDGPRYTLRELIILILTIGLVTTLALAIVAIAVTKLVHPELDLLPVAQLLGQTTQILLGVIVGYLAGKPMER
jgi:hypothetical protein